MSYKFRSAIGYMPYLDRNFRRNIQIHLKNTCKYYFVSQVKFKTKFENSACDLFKFEAEFAVKFVNLTSERNSHET